MVKREYQSIEDEVDNDSLTPITNIKKEICQDKNTIISSALTTPRKKAKPQSSKSTDPGNENGDGESPITPKSKSPAKSRWSASEDEILIGMMEKIIKDHIWAMAKADGRLVSRTSYGVTYHAGMLLRQGTGKGAK